MAMKRPDFLEATVGATAAFGGFQGKAWDQAKAVRIGYTLSATGPYAVGAGIIQAPNYALWIDQLNSKGGIMVKGEGRRPWGTAMHFGVPPVANRYGYPLIGPTVTSYDFPKG